MSYQSDDFLITCRIVYPWSVSGILCTAHSGTYPTNFISLLSYKIMCILSIGRLPNNYYFLQFFGQGGPDWRGLVKHKNPLKTIILLIFLRTADHQRNHQKPLYCWYFFGQILHRGLSELKMWNALIIREIFKDHYTVDIFSNRLSKVFNGCQRHSWSIKTFKNHYTVDIFRTANHQRNLQTPLNCWYFFR